MVTTKNGISISYNGKGDESLSVYAEFNEGLDRSATFDISTLSNALSVQVLVNQSGRREEFTDSDFFVADGGTFNVIKNGLQ